jgi:hypothetical protein
LLWNFDSVHLERLRVGIAAEERWTSILASWSVREDCISMRHYEPHTAVGPGSSSKGRDFLAGKRELLALASIPLPPFSPLRHLRPHIDAKPKDLNEEECSPAREQEPLAINEVTR